MTDKPAGASSAAQPRDLLKHITALDGIRGLAILSVLCFHLLWSNSETGSAVMNFAVRLRSAGWVGVDLFFALSGFLITGILFDSLQDAHYFKNFYVRRILRIFPLYYGVILLLFVVVLAAGVKEVRPLYLLVGYLQNTPLWWSGLQTTPLIDAVNHLWSLAVEEQFYLVWPFVLFLVRDRRRLVWVAAALALAAPISRAVLLAHGAPFQETYKMTICRADSLLGGGWLALMVRGPARGRVLRFAPPVCLLALGLCGAIAWRTGDFDFENNRLVNLFGYSFVAVASTSLIAWAMRPASVVEWVMRGRGLRFLGKYSYGIYVFHELMAVVVSRWGLPVLRAHVHAKALFHLVSMGSVLALTIPLAMLSFHFYERPFLRLKRFFNYGRGDPL